MSERMSYIFTVISVFIIGELLEHTELNLFYRTAIVATTVYLLLWIADRIMRKYKQ